MWKGEFTEELKKLFLEYIKQNNGVAPDEYLELCYDTMTYDEFVSYIKEALRRHCDIVEVVNELEGYTGD